MPRHAVGRDLNAGVAGLAMSTVPLGSREAMRLFGELAELSRFARHRVLAARLSPELEGRSELLEDAQLPARIGDSRGRLGDCVVRRGRGLARASWSELCLAAISPARLVQSRSSRLAVVIFVVTRRDAHSGGG